MNKKLLAIIGILFISFVISWNIFRPGFFTMHDDLQVMRLFEMKRCLNDGQIPCRWSPDMGAGYGQPMFNYYSATPYYTGALFKSIGFSYLSSVKVVMFISIFLAGAAMFLFLSEFLTLTPAFVGGVAYLLVPYRALEVFVRGALAENFALALLPLVLFGIIRLIKNQNKANFVSLAIFSGLFLASHNITSLISLPLIIIFSLALIIQSKNKFKSLALLFASALLALGLASFFLLPVVRERGLINTSLLNSGYFDFRAHFATLNQLFVNQKWGYGASEFGPNDNLSFAVGIMQTLVLIAVPVVLFIKRKSLQTVPKLLLIIFWIVGVGSIFLTTIRSIFIWNFLSPMSFIQFPWRFLGIAALCTSAIAGILLSSFGQKAQKVLSAIFIIALVALNFRYFKFEKTITTATDDTYLSGQGFISQEKSAFYDYRPLSVNGTLDGVAPANPVVLSGLAEVKNFQKRSSYFSADVEVGNGKATVRFPISNFPNWKVYLNSAIAATPFETGKDYGEITLTFDKGITLVQGYFENTPIRTISNIISFISLLIVLVIATTSNDRKNNQEN